MVTPRLTAPQLVVLRALDGLEWRERRTAEEFAFDADVALDMADRDYKRGRYRPWTRREIVDGVEGWFLTVTGQDLVARLKAEGAL